MSTRRIGDFELHELLGEGAMGKVYRAHDVNLDRPVAIKLLGERTLGDPSFTDRFKREARLAAQLNHPHIATIYTFGEEKGEAYIAMEFVEGETLEDLIKRQGPLDVADVKKFGRQAAAALAVAHERGIVHRDIKSANLMVTTGGDIKVMDFGVARRSGETQLTMAGSLIGTANIMAPELIKGEEATTAADLFSLGCVIYEALAGKVAFEGEDPMGVLYKIMHEEPKPLEEKRPDVPGNMLQLIHGLLNKDPVQRFGPAQAVEDVLSGKEPAIPTGGTMALDGGVGTMVLNADAAAGGSILVSEDEGHTPEKEESGSRRRVWLLGGSVVAVVLAIVAFIVVRGGEERDPAMAETWNTQGQDLFESHGGKQDSLKKAQNLFERATRADPEYALAWSNLGLLLLETGSTREAIEKLTTAISLSSAPPEAWNNLGAAYYADGNLEKAEEHLRNATLKKRDYPNAQLFLGRVLEEMGDSTEAEVFYREVVANHPEMPHGFNSLGFLLVQRGRASEAVEVLEDKAAEFDLAPLWKNLGLARLALGKTDAAETAFNEALAKDPGNLEAQVGIARVFEKRGERDAAIREWRNLAASDDSTTAREAEEALSRLSAGS